MEYFGDYGEKLELDKEGYLVNKQYKTAYYLNNNRLVSLKFHKTGAYLKLLHDNVFFDEYSKDIYLFQDGNFKELKENISGGVLRLLDDGSFYSDNLNGIFIFDEEKNEFFPTFIPDDTKESAHYLEDNGEIYLVGDISNRKFPIENNKVLIPPYTPPTVDQFGNELNIFQKAEIAKREQFSMTQEEIDKRIQDLKYQQQRISSSIVKDQEKKLDKIQEFFKKQSDEILNQSKQNLENYRSDIFGPSYDEIKSIFGSDEINMETINYALKNNPENFNNFMLNGSILNNSHTTF